MPSAVVDTNVIIAGVLTNSPHSASRAVIDRLRAGGFDLCISPATIQEVKDVLMLPRMRGRHGLSHDQVLNFCAGLLLNSRVFAGAITVSAALPRDLTDTKWLSLALESDADYLVTSDRRHLQRLRRIGRTRIVTPHAFCLELDKQR